MCSGVIEVTEQLDDQLSMRNNMDTILTDAINCFDIFFIRNNSLVLFYSLMKLGKCLIMISYELFLMKNKRKLFFDFQYD